MKPLLIAVFFLAVHGLAQEDKALATLRSDAPLKDKADACRLLARVGTSNSVPVLAALLADESLSHMARHALEQIPDPSANAALRDALGKLKGRLLIGVIHSLGVRKDADAVTPLAAFLTDPDPAVAGAAAQALGNIGGHALPLLEKAMATAPPTTQLAVCEGLLRCAESMPGGQAAAVYEKLRNMPGLPHHVRVAALQGLVRCRGPEAVPLLAELVRTETYVPGSVAVRMLAEIPGPEATKALLELIGRVKPDTQILLLQTLGDRGDRSASTALAPWARQGSSAARVAAIRTLARLADPGAIPVLSDLAKDPDSAVSTAALASLTGLPGKAAETAVLGLLDEANATLRIAVIDAIAQRRVPGAIPRLLKVALDPDTRVAIAAFQALGELAEASEIAALVDALVHTRAVSAAENALAAVCARQPDKTFCAERIVDGLKKAQGEPKLALLRVLGTIAGPQALAAVRAAAQEPDPQVRETALRVLCDWPTPEALPDLARLATTAPDPKFRILALRAQLRLIPAQTASDQQKVSQIRDLLPLMDRPEEKRLALAALGGLPTVESLALIRPYLSAEGLKQEASLAAVAVAEKIVSSHPAEVADAIQQIQTDNKPLADRVHKLLAQLPPNATETGFVPIFNGKDLTGWDGKPGWWKVEDGALTAESTPDKPCTQANYLIWRGGQPGDFELLVDFKLSLQGNSGIQIRSEERPNWDTFGYQADMTGNGELIGFIYHHSRGLVAGRGEKVVFGPDGSKTTERIGDPARLLKHFKQGDWNTYRIVCRGSDIALYLNGVLMCQVTDRSKQAAARGIIALQMHPGPPMKVQFKNIRLKQL
jgi:HEAT repeat protein